MAADLNMIMVANLRSMGVVIIGFLYLIISGKFQFPNSEDFYKKEISLPIYPLLSAEDLGDIISSISKIIN